MWINIGISKDEHKFYIDSRYLKKISGDFDKFKLDALQIYEKYNLAK